jgi:hypothetical protein
LFYQNCWLHISAGAIEKELWGDMDQLVFAENVKPRDFEHSDNGAVYMDYLNHAVGYSDYTASIIGFLCHGFKDETTGFIPVLTEQCENPEDGGGSGKNVFCNLLRNVTTFVNKNCAGVRYDEKFFQLWKGERIMALSDLPEHFNFLDLKDAATGSITHKRLFKDEVTIQVQDTPKFVCQTNYGVEVKDGGVDRRVCLLEFTDFFTKTGGIDKHYGKHFPNDWTSEDWTGFDNTIAKAIQVWIKQGCTINKPDISVGGWKKKFAQTYGPTTTDIINQYIDKWTTSGKVKNSEMKLDLNEYYSENSINIKYHISTQRLNKALVDYCKHYDIEFNPAALWSELGIKVKGKVFGSGVESEKDGDEF